MAGTLPFAIAPAAEAAFVCGGAANIMPPLQNLVLRAGDRLSWHQVLNGATYRLVNVVGVANLLVWNFQTGCAPPTLCNQSDDSVIKTCGGGMLHHVVEVAFKSSPTGEARVILKLN